MNRAPAKARSENQQISADAAARARLEKVLGYIRNRRDEIIAVLPADVPYAKFEAVFHMAVRRNPELLECYGPTLVKAVIQSAYDGLMPDGKEAVILGSRNKVPGTRDRFRKEARYQTMVYGLRKKIVEAGAAQHIEATCVYRNERFVYEKGLNPRLEHVPMLDEDARGELWAVYSVAILRSGERVFEVMTAGDVARVEAVSKTDTVWGGPFRPEMWRKSVLRRHAKALPTTRPFRDAEALDMFPQFAGDTPVAGELPAPRPTRNQFAGLPAPDVEVPLDLSAFGEDEEGSLVESEEASENGAQRRPQKEKPRAKASEHRADELPDPEPAAGGEGNGEGEASDDTGDRGAAEPAGQRPTDAAGWREWQVALLAEIGRQTKTEDLDVVQDRERDTILAAPAAVKRDVENAIMDKRVDLAGLD